MSRINRGPEHFKGHTGVTGLSYGTHCVTRTNQWPGYYHWKHFNIYRIKRLYSGHFYASRFKRTRGNLLRDIRDIGNIFTCRRPDVPDVPFHLHNSILIITGNTLTYRDVKDFITEQFYASRFKGRPGHCYGTLLRDTRDFIAGHF